MERVTGNFEPALSAWEVCVIEALIDGERRGGVLADLAIGRMRAAGKLADLSMALAGRCTEHHAPQ